MKNDNPFPIRYKRVENGGKHRAINNAVTPKDHIGGISESKYVDAKNTERIKYNLTGDKAEVYYTNVLKNIYFQRLKEKSL